jgi:NADH pyrophosphatase NudC (nudix superfamily)
MQYKFCPKCKGEFEEFFEHDYSRLKCTKCRFIFYDKSYPTVSALIIDDDRVLLSKRAIEPFKGEWDTIGGFLEKGEHPEEGLRREVKEETGLDVEIIKMLGFFMDTYGGEDSTLNIAYLATIKSGEPKPADDVAELKWFSKNELPKVAFKNGQEMLKAWIENERV